MTQTSYAPLSCNWCAWGSTMSSICLFPRSPGNKETCSHSLGKREPFILRQGIYEIFIYIHTCLFCLFIQVHTSTIHAYFASMQKLLTTIFCYFFPPTIHHISMERAQHRNPTDTDIGYQSDTILFTRKNSYTNIWYVILFDKNLVHALVEIKRQYAIITGQNKSGHISQLIMESANCAL